MSNRITIDPITRIEGHLRIDVQIDGGKVNDSWASGTMFRGIETILQGRDPREAWLFAQRFCGVCTTVHGIASVRAVENAAGIQVPLNAQLIRNLILIAHALQDHKVHFYHLCALDWVDVVSALKADPAKTSLLAGSLSPWPRNGYQDFKQVQDRVKAFVDNGQLGIFANGYWGHPAMRLSPEVNLLAVAHYLQALEFQRYANQIVAILGGKTPNIQNLAVGGVANAINLDNQPTLNMDKLFMIKSLFDDLTRFIHEVYFVDACAVAAMYPDWFNYGAGVTNYLAVPDLPLDSAMTQFDLPGGIVFDAKLDSVYTIKNHSDQRLINGVTENVSHAWYEGQSTLHPWKGETNPHYTGFKDDGKYTWVKSPRFEGRPMQVGPLAQVLIGYAQGHKLTHKWAGEAINRVSAISKKQVTPVMLHSTLGRIAARAIRAAMLADLANKHWDLLVKNIASGDAKIFVKPQFGDKELHGVGFHEAPRGTLSHWVVIKDGQIANYQAVVPTTWNAGPRDEHGSHGPYEASLLGNPVADAERPLEVLRTVHSFDPCLACAIHTFDPEGKEVIHTSREGGSMHDTLNSAPLKVGEKTIDAEHDLQMQLLDSLSQSLATGGDFSPTRHILEQFIEFSDMHFLSEQLIMRLNAYPAYETHLEEHTRLMKKVREIRENIIHGEKTSSLQLILELRDWLLHHIATEDAAFGEFLAKKEVASS